jgi:hypothetical protein
MSKRQPPPEPVNIWTLYSGQAVRVVKTFKDYSGHIVEKGTILHFEKRDFLPYHEGHTVYFKEVTLYLCGLDETTAIVQNLGNEFFEPYGPPLHAIPRPAAPAPPPPPRPAPVAAPEPAPAPVPPPVPKKPVPKMPHMRFEDMYMELRVVVVQEFKDALGRSFPEGLEMRFLQFNGYNYCFLGWSIHLEPGDPILENEGNAWLRPVPCFDSIVYGLQFLNLGWPPRSPPDVRVQLDRCNEWLKQPVPRGEAPKFPIENLPFAEAFVLEGVKHLLDT